MAAEWLGCSTCKWYDGAGTCKAYPARIPAPFASGEIKHSRVAPGQVGGYVYEFLPKSAQKKRKTQK